MPVLEGAQREMPSLSGWVGAIERAHGAKKDLVLMDNNVTASRRYQEVIAEIRDLGFEAGAKLPRPGRRAVKRRVDFNQGVDARILSKSPMYLKEMATVCIDPLRIAFDHTGMRKVYERAVHMAADSGITALSNYMLYNFMDTPGDLHDRMRINIELNETLGIRIWSFPMRYQPVTLKERSHVGKHWTRYLLRSFQLMLQASRGVVSGNPEFFRRAYGESREAFMRLLGLPHAFIFHRAHYETGAGRAVREAYEHARARLAPSEEAALGALLAGPEHAGKGVPRSHYRRLACDRTLDARMREIMRFHTLDTGDKIETHAGEARLDDQRRVEDAGLEEAGEWARTR